MSDVGYCERDDVLDVLQEANLSGALSQDPEIIDAAILAQTEYIRAKTMRHWYDPNAPASSLLPTDTVQASDRRFDVPSSPHAQDRQIYRHDAGTRYPVSTDGPYVRIRLDHAEVDSLGALRIRDSSGDFTDWTSDPEFVQGRGEDYYLNTPTDAGPAGYSRLYLHEGSLPVLSDYQGAVLADYDYGRPEVPDSVKRMTAYQAATSLVEEDEFVAALPDDGQLTGVETKADRWSSLADGLMAPYMDPVIA
jgi:hypothetical protein